MVAEPEADYMNQTKGVSIRSKVKRQYECCICLPDYLRRCFHPSAHPLPEIAIAPFPFALADFAGFFLLDFFVCPNLYMKHIIKSGRYLCLL
jgi:hypothetical protein